MSLGYMSRELYQAGMRVMQGMKAQTSNYDTAIRSIKDNSTTLMEARRFSGATGEKLKHAEESLRTVMFLSCWGPN